MQQAWTLREVARVAGRSRTQTAELARAGMLPGYTGLPDGRKATGHQGAQVPVELATAYACALRAGLCSTRLAELMRESPSEVVAAAEALLTLARAAQTAGTDTSSGEAA